MSSRAPQYMTSPGRYPSAKVRKSYADYQSGMLPSRPAAPAPARPGAQQTDMQRAGVDIAGVYNPVIQQLNASIAARAKAGMGAIGGYANQLASSLGGVAPQLEGIYQRAQQGQAASDAALTGALRDSSSQGADELAGRLAQIGGGLEGVVGEQRQVGQGAAGAMLGMGSASLSQLLSQGAASAAYGATMPAIAKLGGLAGGRELQLSSQRELADQMGRLSAEIPGAVLERADYLGDTRRQQQEAGYGRWQDTLDRRFDQQQFAYGQKQDRLDRQADADAIAWEQRLAASAGLFNNDNLRTLPDGSLGVVDPQTGQVQVVAPAPPPEPEPVDPNTYRDKGGRTVPKGYEYDGQGRLVRIPTPKTGAAAKETAPNGLTPTAYATKKKQALDAARVFYEGKESASGQITASPLDYQDALRKLMRGFSLTLEDAVKIADTYWQKGESDRPWLSYRERAALRSLGVSDQVLAKAMWNEAHAKALLSGRMPTFQAARPTPTDENPAGRGISVR